MGDRGHLTAQGAARLASGVCDRSRGDCGPNPVRISQPAHTAARTDPAPPPMQGTPTPPTRWAGDRYEVGALLGRGGAGEVYRGFDRTLHRHVAIKVLRDGQGAEQAARFAREVRLLARLQHPHLIPLYDAALGDGRCYLVMPLVRGTTLAGRIATGPVSAGEAERIGTALAEALAYIHARGVVHRDVKPSNILLGDAGQIALADFGIARSDESEQTVTAPGQLTGTAAYVAPEQVKDGEAGPGCDVYALGLVLLEALTGVRAFPGTLLEQALGRLWRQPVIPLSLGPHWVRLLDAMTARDPAQRPDPLQISAALRHLTDPEPVATTTLALPVTSHAPRSAPAPAERRRRRPVSRAAVGALSACVLAAGAAAAVRPPQDSAAPATPPSTGVLRILAPGPARVPAAASRTVSAARSLVAKSTSLL